MQQIVGLNWLRGISALLVALSHARPFFYENFSQLGADVPPLVKGFYLVTSLGHPAVMVFFVLSGYLVAGSAYRSHTADAWSWRNYLTSRLSRLCVVLVPCLILTFGLDMIGQYGFGSGFYIGEHPEYWSDPEAGGQMGIAIFIGNIFFVQTILVPTFGSNGPLWSIAYEFWYYILFPLAMLALLPGRPAKSRIIALIVFGVIALAVGGKIMALFPVWLLGFVAWKLRESAFAILLRRTRIGLTVAFSTVILMLGFRAMQAEGLLYDYIFGCMVALSLPVLTGSLLGRGAAFAHRLSDMSYSLYLSHFPVLALLAATHGNTRSTEITADLPLFFAWLMIVFIVAFAIWAVFERNTNHVRDWLRAL
ncbi:acyltransferase family protein [Albirhodobacter sp. R86504]|uniref:acyltransferase family protein n=1 Tax=Albirhodobacter sp. R86504 TaxID=3093848 RepID=UPI00366B0069